MEKFKSEVIEVIHELTDELESSSAHHLPGPRARLPVSVVLTSGGDELVEAFSAGGPQA